MYNKALIYFLLIPCIYLMGSCSFKPYNDHDDKYIPLYKDKLDSGSKLLKAWSYYSFEKNSENYILKIYYPSARVLTDYLTYADPNQDILNGKIIKWYDNGNLYLEGYYLMNKRAGEWKLYNYDTGKLSQTGFYKNGLKDSLWTDYDTLGNVVKEIYYEDDNMHGPFKIYEDGKLVEEGMMISDSIIFDTVYATDKISYKDIKLEQAILEVCKNEETLEDRYECTQKKWSMMLHKILKNSEEITDLNFQGTAVVRYKVTKEGNIEDIKVLRGISDSIKEVVYKIYNSKPKFLPAEKNGEPVDSYRTDYLPLYEAYFKH